jgi:hypothetical protein
MPPSNGSRPSGTFRQHRRPLDEIRHDTRLVGLLAAWESKRVGGRPPNLDPGELRVLIGLAGGYMHVVDTTAAEPAGYFFKFWGSAVSLDNFANYQGLRLGQFRSGPVRDGILHHYHAAASEAVPLYDVVTAHIPKPYWRATYTRVSLPLSTSGLKVDRLLVAFHKPSPPGGSDDPG